MKYSISYTFTGFRKGKNEFGRCVFNGELTEVALLKLEKKLQSRSFDNPNQLDCGPDRYNVTIINITALVS